MECNGDGYCLNNKSYVCKYECSPVECPNFFICKQKFPQCILDFNSGVCFTCMNLLKKMIPLEFSEEEIECPVCFTNTYENIKNPNCNHFLCIDCFGYIYGYKNTHKNEPVFPFFEKEEDYYKNPELFTDDAIINSWKRRWIEWNQKKEEKIMKKCPLCRK